MAEMSSLPQWAQDKINQLEDKIYHLETVLKTTYKENKESASLAVIWPDSGEAVAVKDDTIFCFKFPGDRTIKFTLDKKFGGIHVRSSSSLQVFPLGCNLLNISHKKV